MGKDYFPVLILLLFEINPPNSVGERNNKPQYICILHGI
jgi:hypothetical protein